MKALRHGLGKRALPLLLAGLQASRPAPKPLGFLEILQRRAQLVAAARWPWPALEGLLWCARLEDLAGERLRLGGLLYDRGLDFALPLPAGLPRRAPFAGLDPRAFGLVVEAGAPGSAILTLELAQPAHLCFPGDRGPAARRAFLWNVLAAAFRRASAARAPDPGPGRRGRAHARARLAAAAATRRAPLDLASLPGLPATGFFVRAGGKLEPAPLERAQFRPGAAAPAEVAACERLLTRFLAGLRWPLPDPPGTRRRLFPDDLPGRHGLEEHHGLDLGAALLDARGRAVHLRPGTPIGPPHARARPVPLPRRDGRAWLVELAEGRYRLRVLLALFHVRGEPPTLAPGPLPGGWYRAADPWRRRGGPPKGPHVHLELLGPFPGAPNLQARFLEDPLPRRLLAAPSSLPGAAPAARPAPSPPPGLPDPEETRALERWARAYLRARPGESRALPPAPLPKPLRRVLERRLAALRAQLRR